MIKKKIKAGSWVFKKEDEKNKKKRKVTKKY
jgi:hypothetical protein